jgi:hypothetical protein
MSPLHMLELGSVSERHPAYCAYILLTVGSAVAAAYRAGRHVQC